MNSNEKYWKVLESIASPSLYVQLTAVNLLMNYIALVAGVPTRMHFTDDYLIERTIMEKESGKPRVVKSLVFQVDELNGEEVNRTFSVMSQKLQAPLEPFRKGKEYIHYDFIITKMGDSFYVDWNVQPIRRPQ